MKECKWYVRAKYPDGKLLGEGKSDSNMIRELIHGYSEKAQEKMVKEKADHVLYAIEKHGLRHTVTLYCQPLTDDEFSKYFAKTGKKIVYAVHNPKFAEKKS